MKKILLTGGSGFIGRNILPILREKYEVDAPARRELDLKDSAAVIRYVQNGNYDAVIQAANPNPVKNAYCDKAENMFEDSMRIFMNFYHAREYCGKLLYFGSGAEYDKSREICKVREEEIGQYLPQDIYGLTKYLMNELTRSSENIINLRIFGCYGPYDHESKFLTHVIRCCLKKQEITIRQNCYFDYTQVYNLADAIQCIIEGTPQFHDYNICSGDSISLVEIAEIIRKRMQTDNQIILLNQGFNKEYTADNSRFVTEFGGDFLRIGLEQGIDLQIEHEKKVMA